MQRRLLLFPLLILILSGCQSEIPFLRKVSIQEQLLVEVRKQIALGDTVSARRGLDQLIAAAPQQTVTDEALFRRAIFALNEEDGAALILLNRLQQQFSESIWNHQAAPLKSYLVRVKTLKDRQRELASLKSLNLSLHKDNRELRQTLEKLKALDLELEQKIRR